MTNHQDTADPLEEENNGRGKGNGGANLNTRLTRLETHFKYLVTKADLQESAQTSVEIKTKLEGLATKADVYKWFGIVLLVYIVTLVSHLLLRSLSP